MNKRILLLVGILLVIFLGAVCIGSTSIQLSELKDIFLKFFLGIENESIDNSKYLIATTIRLPRALVVCLVGGALAVSGAIIQSILNNPIATPYTLGVSSGAALGTGLVIVSGFEISKVGQFSMPLVGFLFGFITILIVIQLANKTDVNLSDYSIILSGVIISLFISAALTLVSVFNQEKMNQITLWQLGSFSGRGWSQLTVLIPFLLVSFVWLMFYIKDLDILSFGTDSAHSLGINTTKTKKILLIITTLISGSCVAICGIIGFVDLIAPHVARRLVGAKHNKLLPATFLVGASLLLVADTMSRTLFAPIELPIGAITAVIGVPFFIYIYTRKAL
ncbi:FecCD family ABC transporter permease [Mycoplasma sp. P36-A1]|uniref:FecCD family ABC transporter permease n=1 Tax=Mycoplasma sp. P36-A1 TaxID=3252900 RepID=UPI003C2DDE24